MDNRILCAALSNVCEEELLGFYGESAYEEHTFSKRFEGKMRTIIHPSEPVNIKKRIRLAFVAAAILAAGFLLGMSSGGKWGFDINKNEDGVYASFNVDSVKDAKKKVTDRYELGFVPQGAILTASNIFMQRTRAAMMTGRLSAFAAARPIITGIFF